MENVKGQVGIPTGYFLRMAKHDYDNYLRALPREFYQNSVDAGARNIWVICDESLRTIKVVDDGHGMSMDTLQNKLLVLGGSEKRSGSTGAFGKAKELLFFSWERYEIKTRDLHCIGQGSSYEIKKRNPNDDKRETVCEIVIPEDEDFSRISYSFKLVAQRFEAGTSIFVDGEEIRPTLIRDSLLREVDWASIYTAKNTGHSYWARVRVNGQWMFNHFHGVDEVGEIIIELNKQSTEILTSNRDGIKGENSRDFHSLIKEIILERKEFIKPAKKIVREIITGKGTNKVNWEDHRSKVKKDMEHKRVDFVLGEIPADRLIGELIALVGETDILRAALVRKELEDNPQRVYDIADRLSFIGYEPDFVLVYEEGDSECGMDSFMLDRKKRILAHMWTEIVKQVLIDIEWSGEFICGFDFTEDTVASYAEVEGVSHFYLNPDLVCADVPGVNNPFQNKTLLRKDLIMTAIHEVCHTRYKYHDSDFTSYLHFVAAKTWRSERIFTAIVRDAFSKE